MNCHTIKKKNNLLISVRPKFAVHILSGKKIIELRRVRPKVSPGDNIFFYISSPEKTLWAMSRIKKITSGQLDKLWEEVKGSASVSQEDYFEYFKGTDLGHAIYFTKIIKFHNPIKLSNIKKLIPGFMPPQSFRYFSQKELATLLAAGFMN